MKKHLLLLSFAILFALFCCFCACDNGGSTPTDTPADSKQSDSRWADDVRFVDSEIYVPENSRIGFYYVEADGRTYVKCNYGATKRDDLFDPTKPTFIFIHGMQVNTGYHGDEGMGTSYPADEGMEEDTVYEYALWQEAGYNTLAFYYSAYADDGLIEIVTKVWGIKNENSVNMRWAYPDDNDKKVYETKDVPNASIAEIFAHEYAALFADYSGSEVRLSCHSMGGQVCLASASALNTLDDRGEIPHAALPSRVIFLDPYIEDFFIQPAGTTCFDGTEYTSSYDKFLSVADKLFEKGVAIEYFDGEIGFRWRDGTGMDATHFAELQKKCAYIDFVITPDSLVSNFALDFLGQYHNIVKHVYIYSLILDLIPDNTVEDSGNYSLSAAVPTEIIDSYRGNTYKMVPTDTFDPSDDIVTLLTPRTGATIFGYAFSDDNKNGLRDEDYTCRIRTLTVKLYDSADVLVAETKTDNVGRYRFDNLNAGEYYCVFDMPNGYSATEKTTDAQLKNSDIDQNGKSDNIVLATSVSYGYINAGFVREEQK